MAAPKKAPPIQPKKGTPVDKVVAGDHLLTKGELENSPDLVRRYIRKFREANGINAQRHTRESTLWFQKRVSKDFNVRAQRKQLMETQAYRHRGASGIEIGRMYLFHYDAIDEGGKLPYWDMFPVTFFFNKSTSKAGKHLLHGLNLHYLPPRLRYILLLELMKLKTSKGYTPRTRLRLQYEAIKAASVTGLYEPCIKTYRVDHIRSEMTEINANDWEIVTFLNIDQWQKAGRDVVYKDALAYKSK
uniref:DNA end protector protein n=1 Tax=Pseudomonas phage Cygsa01 TaxID=3138529 RepID=A0AAU6W509_9VIRU